MKKDGIQTRNRKLAARAKRGRCGVGPGGIMADGVGGSAGCGVNGGSMQDFFKPLDSARFGYGGMAAAHSAGYFAAGTGYYGQMQAAAAQSAAFGHPHHAAAAASVASMASMASNFSPGFGSTATGFSLGGSAHNPMMAGATA